MAKKRVHIQHIYTSGTTISPSSLVDGEIGIGYNVGDEKLFIKNNNGETTEFISKDATSAMTETQITNRIGTITVLKKTQEEYNEMKENGTLDSNTLYVIV